jgi:uncharacterized protein with NAD-binding domain and iron-sulfur cluster
VRPQRHVAVVGGGLAGITAAIALSEMGARVTLLEARPRLGGATTSFSRGGLSVDNGQHIFLRCCHAYRTLLARLGMSGSVALQDRFDVTVLAPWGRARLWRDGLPGPLHMARALAGYRFLTPAQRLRVLPAAAALARLAPAGRADAGLATARGSSPKQGGPASLGAASLGEWLAAHGQDERTRRVLWDLFTVSTLNMAGDGADLALAATVVRTALLGRPDAADIGVPAVPLGDLHGRAAAALLARLGATVRLSAKVSGIEPAGPRGFSIRLREPAGGAGSAGAAGPQIDADAVVLAVPPKMAAGLVPPGAVTHGPGPAQWAGLGESPIVNVHVVYDRRVTRLPFAAAVDSPVQWVFDRSRTAGLESGQYLAVSVSAADACVDAPAATFGERFIPALAELFPAARQARVLDFFVTRERRATIRQGPGCGVLRPGQATALPGLVLAGAWTETGWPDTMEGAVRSGLMATRQVRLDLAAGPAGPAGAWTVPPPAEPSGRQGLPLSDPGPAGVSA